MTSNKESNRARTVLLVDDIPEYLDAMELNLPDGCVAVRSQSFDEARRITDSVAPTLVVVDVRLREEDAANRDGLDLLQWLRRVHPRIPVMMISAYREFEFEAESLALGARRFLHKPIDPDNFREAVARVLREL